MTKRRYYIAGNGVKYPLYEAPYKYSITVYKADCKKAVTGDPSQCLIAMGARRDKQVEGAYIGSGKDAYVIFKALRGKPAHALHYTLNAQASRVRDFFDTHKGVATHTIELSAVTAGRTLDHRSKLGKKRAAAIKNGTHTVKSRGKQNATRIMRIGVKHRPKANITENVVTMKPREQEIA
jgi:hypothetical protein